MIDYFRILPQKLLPQHGVSRLVGKLAVLKRPTWLKNWFIKIFIKRYGVNMLEALQPDPQGYANFNSFFIRQLIPGIRPIEPTPNAIVSPADGTVCINGKIEDQRLIQAKNHYFNLKDLLGGDEELAQNFQNGEFATIYLAPKDYHRVHMPLEGNLSQMLHVPGKLFSVNERTSNSVPNLFANNERVIALFQTDAGKMAVILVGAMIVSSIVTNWAGIVTPPQRKEVRRWQYQSQVYLDKGAELGYFQLGSTVILLFQAEQITWSQKMMPGQSVRMGQLIGTRR